MILLLVSAMRQKGFGQGEQNIFQKAMCRRQLRALVCLVLICSLVLPQSYVLAHAAHTHSDACYTSSVRAHVHTGSSSTGTGCYAAGEYVAGHTYTCGELDTSSYRTIDRVEYVSHGCTSMELSGYESQYRCKGCGEYITYYWAVYCSDCDYSSWNGLSSYVHKYYVEPHYELGCGKTEGTYYNMEMHQEHSHCSEKESVCVVCDGTGEMKDHKASWTYPGYDIVTNWLNSCVYCGWEDADGIPCFRYECSICDRTISVRGCCDYERYASEYQYCTVSCSVCDGKGTVRGYFDTCDAGCVLHTGHSAACYGDSTPHYFTKVYSDTLQEATSTDDCVERFKYTWETDDSWKQRAPVKGDCLRSWTCSGKRKLLYYRTNVGVFCNEHVRDYSYGCSASVTMSCPLYKCDTCGALSIDEAELEPFYLQRDYLGYDPNYGSVYGDIYYVETTQYAGTIYDESGNYVGARRIPAKFGDVSLDCADCFRTDGYTYTMERKYSYSNTDRCPSCNGHGVKVYPPCPYVAGEYYDGTPAEPVCSRVVTSLVPVSPVQTIMIGESPDVKAVATFLDKTKETVTCSYTGFNANTYGTAQTVTLSYGTYHDSAKNPGAKTCTIKVTVQGYYELAVSSSNVSMGTVAGGGSKLTGSTVTVKAIPVGSNRFTGWYEDSTLVSTQASYRFTMPARNVTLVARFIRIPVSLTAVPDKNMVYNGSEPSYAVTVKYSDGSSVALTPLQYTKSGFTKGTGVKTVSFSYTESGVTVATAISVTVIRNTRTCKYGHTYELSDNDTDEGCSKCATTLDSISAYPSEQAVSPGGTPNFLVTGTYLDGHSVALYGWTTNFNSSGLGVQYVTITYGGQTCQAVVKVVKTFTCGVCGTVYEANEDLSNPGCPECRRSCVSIAVSPATQMVEQGSPISITVTARFRDGHTEEVTDWSSNYRPYTLGKQRVAVMYGGQTASVEVEVVAKKAICINCGTAYDPMQGWCPNCGHVLNGIRATTLDGSNLVITGIRPEFKVYGIYLDGHEERIEGGYTYSGLDIYTAGVQNVTVSYGGFSCTVSVTVLDGAGYNMCERGHVYQLNSDGSDSGCPYCSIDEDDKTEKFYTTSYTDEIMGQLYRDGVYYLKDGDAVTITVKRQEKSGIVKLFDWIFNRFGDALNIKAGGIVGE